MSDSRTSSLVVAFDAGQLTSDGGLVWLAQADDRLGLSVAFAAQLRDWRRGPVCHPHALLVRQRILQIACGYADQDDADTLRRDPLLKLVCGRRPHEPSADLASQPTLSRVENAVDRRACYRLAQALLGMYLQERERDGHPTHLLLGLDSTDDPTHGEQQGSSYHGYDQQHMYHPLLITAVLRHGTVHASRRVVAILTRLVMAVRARWPQIAIELRADSGFAIPALYDYCERERISYTIGLAPNTRLQTLAAPLVEQAKQLRQQTGEKARLLAEGRYAADSWLLDTLRRLLIQAGIARMQLDTLRLRLIKIGGWLREPVREQAQTLSLHLASSHPGEPLWHLLAARFKPHA